MIVTAAGLGNLPGVIAAGEIVSNIDWLGVGQRIAMPVDNGDFDTLKSLIHYLFAGLGIGLFIFLDWLYKTRLGAAIYAIRDDEEKAEAMGRADRCGRGALSGRIDGLAETCSPGLVWHQGRQ